MFEVAQSPDLLRQVGVGLPVRRPGDVDHALLVGVTDKLPVELGPAFGLDLPLKRTADVEIGARAEFLRDEVLRPIAHPAFDIVAVNHKIAAVIGAAAHDDMDMRVVGVPMIDGNPLQFGAEVFFRLPHQLAREPLQILHVGGVLRGHNEPEMMAVVLAALREILHVGVVGLRLEHFCALAVTGDTVAAKVVEVAGERTALTLVADHERLDGAKPRAAGDEAVGADAGDAATREVRSTARRDLAGARDTASGLLRGGERLGDEGQGALRSR